MNLKTLSFLSLLFLYGCGGGESQTVVSASNFSASEKAFVYNLFKSEYLWYDQVSDSVDYNRYNDPKSMVNALRVNPPDRWSFTITKSQYETFVNQETSGFGFGYRSDFLVYLVRIDSPSWNKLRRGDKIVRINGEEVSTTLIHDAARNLGVSSTFTVERNGTLIEVDIVPQVYTYKVTLPLVHTIDGIKIGYLRYDSFSGASVEEIERAFTQFKNEKVDELVIDLRYNGGGAVSVASILLDNITNRYPSQTQFYLDWNDNYKRNNENYRFENRDEQEGNELSMSRVFFLVTQNSASASELVISALKPYLGDANVITIGEHTHGKNVGMRGRSYQGSDNYYFLINFYVRNSDGITTGTEGIPPVCDATDDISRLRGDPEETMFKTAIHYIRTGSCL